MPIHTIQSNFLGGEVSPHLYTRTDTALYSSWVKKACNFLIHPQGGASNRPGTAYVNQTKFPTQACRLIPFVLSQQESYVLEVGPQYIRVHTQAGTLLDHGIMYEIATPYVEADIPAIAYVQNGAELYLVHGSYMPRKLVKAQDGYFSLQTLSLTGGPFRLANTDESKQMHLVRANDTVYSTGVKATLSFLPINYPNYFIQAFWRGERFYDPSGFGFNIAEVVQYFNERYASTGCVAYDQGGVLRIESPQNNGADYNGSQLVIHYRSGLLSEPKLIVTQVMSGGQNAGEVISTGETKLYLESNFDVFRPGQVGGLWALTHRVESSYETGTLGYSGVSKVIASGGDWGFRTTGSWYGEVVLEQSEDGVTWSKVKHFTKAEGENNLNQVGNLPPSAKLHYLRLRCLGIAGEMGYVLQSQAFNQEGIVCITGYVNARKVLVTIQRQPGAEDWTSDWAQGAFSTDTGFPTCVFFYQDRLGFAATERDRQNMWFSKTGEYTDFGYNRTLTDDDAISISLSGKKLNAIHSVAVGGKLFVFTDSSEWSVGSNGAFTPYQVEIAQEGERGASTVSPLVVGNRVLYVQSRGGALRDFYYEYSSASYTGRDLTLRAKHLFVNSEIKEIVYQQEPNNLIWTILEDGSLLSLTYLAEENVLAWTEHQTQGKVKSACVVAAKGYDEMWFLVQRNGHNCIERLLPRLNSREPADQNFLDSSVSKKSLQPFCEISGLTHLEGCSVKVLADGNVIEGLSVKNGTISLPYEVRTAHVGLGYEASLETLPADFTLTDGTVQDRKRRIVQVMLHVLDSRGGKVGYSEGKLDELIYAQPTVYQQAADLQSKAISVALASTHTYFPSIKIVQDVPLPLTVLALISKID